MGALPRGNVVKRSDCILVYGSTTKGDVGKSLTDLWDVFTTQHVENMTQTFSDKPLL